MSLSEDMNEEQYRIWEQVCYELMEVDKKGHSKFSTLFWDNGEGGTAGADWSPTDYSSRVDTFLEIIGKVMGE